VSNSGGPDLKNALQVGNSRSSRFTATAADTFSKEWRVVEHQANTTTGFSGTLFENANTRELVLSFRSTEFIDDNARDNKATNELELNEFGWAFGQIADMESWYQTLKAKPELLGRKFTVTGYSLGGHLAAAFAMLRDADATAGEGNPIAQAYTFNGVNRGQIPISLAAGRPIVSTGAAPWDSAAEWL